MGKLGKYIYGVINLNTALRFFIPKDFFEGEKSGFDGVYTVPYQDVSAVVTDAEIVDYTKLRKDALARLLVGHQKVIERIMDLAVEIIPLRLGTFAQDEIELKDILNKGYNLIKHISTKINNKIEFDVVATWSDFNSVLKEAAEEKEIKELKEKLLSNPKRVTVDDQMKIGFMVKKALDEKRERYAFQIQNTLKNLSEDSKIHELMDDKMVINIAVLIDKSKQMDFDGSIEKLNSQFAEKLNFRCVGPLPPYSFYTLEIKKLQFEEIDWARKKLGLLNDISSRDEIKKAYQRLAFSSHPDKNPDIPGIEREFDQTKKAYEVLLDYYQACEQAGQAENFSFKEDEFKKNAILVKVRG